MNVAARIHRLQRQHVAAGQERRGRGMAVGAIEVGAAADARGRGARSGRRRVAARLRCASHIVTGKMTPLGGSRSGGGISPGGSRRGGDHVAAGRERQEAPGRRSGGSASPGGPRAGSLGPERGRQAFAGSGRKPERRGDLPGREPEGGARYAVKRVGKRGSA